MSLPSGSTARGRGEVPRRHAAPEWVGAAPPRTGLPLYVDVLRSRLWLIVLIVALSVLAAGIVVATTEKVYKAEADLLVTPIPGNNTSLYGFGLPTESGDPTRDVETLAQVIPTPVVAERVRRRLRLGASAESLLSRISAEPVAQSSIVTVTAEANDPELAASLANAFGEEAIAVRTERFHSALDAAIPRLREQLANVPPGDTAAREALVGRVQDLETYRSLPDPTLHLETEAVAPSAPVAPRPIFSIAAALVAALILGIGAVLGSHLFDTRIVREEDLRRYRIPILARIPRETTNRRVGRRDALLPSELSIGAADAYRRLSSWLAALSDGDRRNSIFVTSAEPSVGKTTTSLNLAASFAMMNERVILVEADSRRPTLGRALGITPTQGLSAVVAGESTVGEALKKADGLYPGLRILLQEPGDDAAATPMSPVAADALARDAERLAEWVVFDGPALNYVPEALPLARRADSVIVVVRLNKTRARELQDLAELLVQQGITPDGFVVVGGRSQPTYY